MAYTSEDERELEELKSWWKENSKIVIFSVILAIAASFGWRYWQEHQVNQQQNASDQYEQILDNYRKNPKAAEGQLTEFIKAHDKTTYTVFALLDKAKSAVLNKNFSVAEQALQQAMGQSADNILTSLIALRLAEVQFEQKKYDVALNSLNSVTNEDFSSRKDSLVGDILYAKGDKAGAKKSYQQAESTASPLEKQWLQVRLNNL